MDLPQLPPESAGRRENDDLDERLDAFESAWRGAAELPQIEQFAPPIGDPNRTRALAELIMIDQERQYRRINKGLAGGMLRTDALPTLQTYLQRFPDLTHDPASVAALVCFEARQRVGQGETLTINFYGDILPADVIQPRLRALFAELTGASLTLYIRQEPPFRVTLPAVLELGRMQEGDPHPPRLVNLADHQRLVIAQPLERTISRRHVLLEIVGNDFLLLRNLSQKSSLGLSGHRLGPGETCEIRDTTIVSMDERVLRLELRSRRHQ